MNFAVAFLFSASLLSWNVIAATAEGPPAGVQSGVVTAPVNPIRLGDLAVFLDARFDQLDSANADLRADVARLAREVADLKQQGACR